MLANGDINMSLGMKRGIVYLEEHQIMWEQIACETVLLLRAILENCALDIQHVGSTSIKTIPAKPIIDIAVAVDDFEGVLNKKEELSKNNVIFRFDERPEQLLYVMGDFENDTRTHHIHVVRYDSKEWINYINFRDYLNYNKEAAREYADVKKHLAEVYPNDRIAYTNEKSSIISKLLSDAAKWRKLNG